MLPVPKNRTGNHPAALHCIPDDTPYRIAVPCPYSDTPLTDKPYCRADRIRSLRKTVSAVLRKRYGSSRSGSQSLPPRIGTAYCGSTSQNTYTRLYSSCRAASFSNSDNASFARAGDPPLSIFSRISK